MLYAHIHPADFLIKTQELNHIQKVVYLTFWLIQANNEKALPKEEKQLRKILNRNEIRVRSYANEVHKILQDFFILEEDGWWEPDIKRQVSIVQAGRQNASEAGKRSASVMRKRREIDVKLTRNAPQQNVISLKINDLALTERVIERAIERETLSAVCATRAHPLPALKKDKLVNTNKTLSWEEQWTSELPTNAELDHLPDDEVYQFIMKLNTAYQEELNNYAHVFGEPPTRWLSNHEDHGHRHRLAMLRQAIHQKIELR